MEKTYTIDVSSLEDLELDEFLDTLEWTERYGIIPKSINEGVSTGFKPYAYQRDILKYMTMGAYTVNGVPVWKISVPKAVQVGYTRMLTFAMGRHIDQSGGNLLHYSSVETLVKAFYEKEIVHMFKETPKLTDKVSFQMDKKDNQAATCIIRFKNGTSLRLFPANPSALRYHQAEFLSLDEVDGWVVKSTKGEGNLVKLAINRTKAKSSRLVLCGSSPVKTGESLIMSEYALSDKRVWMVKCPLCGYEQELHFNRLRCVRPGVAESVVYVCLACGKDVPKEAKIDMVNAGRWVSTAPGGVPAEPGHIGFHLSGMIALGPNNGWDNLMSQKLLCKSLDEKQTFFNTALGLVYDPRSADKLPSDRMLAVASQSNYAFGTVPREVIIVIMVVDVQGGGGSKRDRLEVAWWGFGNDGKMWLLQVQTVPGDPQQSAVWDVLSELKAEPLDSRLPSLTVVDAGGHATADVFEWCTNNDYAIPIRGASSDKSWEWTERRSIAYGVPYLEIGTHACKEVLHGRYLDYVSGINNLTDFPNNLTAGQAEQLCSETRVPLGRMGRWKWMKTATDRPNELWDQAVYAYGIVRYLLFNQIDGWESMKTMAMQREKEIASFGASSRNNIDNLESSELEVVKDITSTVKEGGSIN